MVTKTKLIIALAVTFVVTAVLVAQQRGFPARARLGHPSHPRAAMMTELVADYLELTDSQKEQAQSPSGGGRKSVS